MENFTPVASLLGGLMIGLSAAMLLYINGKIAGISGILGGLVNASPKDVSWRLLFLGGLVAGGIVMVAINPAGFEVAVDRSTGAFILAGLLVGFGTRMGNGCTSGHGICGMSRLSVRSIAATLSFMGAGFVTVYLVNHVLGGVL